MVVVAKRFKTTLYTVTCVMTTFARISVIWIVTTNNGRNFDIVTIVQEAIKIRNTKLSLNVNIIRKQLQLCVQHMELLDLVTRITGHLLNNKPAFKRRIIDWRYYPPLTQPILRHIMGKYCNIPVSISSMQLHLTAYSFTSSK